MTGNEGWASLFARPELWPGFASLFEPGAQAWLERHVERLSALEKRAFEMPWVEGAVHLDLRSDNLLYSRSRGPLIVDWPYLTRGARLLDVVFMLPSVASEGGPTPERALEMFREVSGLKFSPEQLHVAVTLTAGFFARRAHLPEMAGLPRLRWVQKQQLFPALAWMCHTLGIEPLKRRE